MNSKVNASTLVEVVVALLIIMIVFTTSTSLFVHIMHATPEKKSNWNQELQALADTIKKKSEVNNEVYPKNKGTVIYQYCEPYTTGSSLLHLKLEVINDTKVLASHEEIFFKKTN